MAATNWTAVLVNHPVRGRISESFVEVERDYIEKIANSKNLGDAIVRQLKSTRKPAALTVTDYLARSLEWEAHLNGGYLRSTHAKPNKHQKAEQIFNHQTKHHQESYDWKHDEIEHDFHALKTFFEGCHTINVNDKRRERAN